MIALVVAIGTLLIQGSTLPAFIRALKLESDGEAAYNERQYRLAHEVTQRVAQETMQKAFEQLAAKKASGVDAQVVEKFVARFAEAQRARQQLIDDLGPADSEAEADDPGEQKRQLLAEQFQKVRLEVLQAQRKALIAERDAFRLDDDVYRELIEQLDFDEASVEARLQSRLQ